jgi:hypothetical protein
LLPNQVVLRSSDDGISGDVNTDFSIAAPTSGTVSFDWNYSTLDDAAYDDFGYLLNGAFTQLTNDAGSQTQSGSVTFSVLATDTFGFRQNSEDSCCGRASTNISNFNGPIASVPGPLPILGLGVAFAYSRRLRRRINLAKSPVGTDTATADQL